MSNASLKEQLQAFASQLPTPKAEPVAKKKQHTAAPKKKFVKSNEKAKKPRPKWLEQALYGVELLRAYFPACFTSSHEIKPLKKGIKQDLVKHLSTLESVVTEDKACMIRSLAYYVNTSAYHKCVIEGATRIDLTGAPAGVVTAEEAKYSIEKQQAKLQAKKAAASQAQPKDGNTPSEQST